MIATTRENTKRARKIKSTSHEVHTTQRTPLLPDIQTQNQILVLARTKEYFWTACLEFTQSVYWRSSTGNTETRTLPATSLSTSYEYILTSTINFLPH